MELCFPYRISVKLNFFQLYRIIKCKSRVIYQIHKANFLVEIKSRKKIYFISTTFFFFFNLLFHFVELFSRATGYKRSTVSKAQVY